MKTTLVEVKSELKSPIGLAQPENDQNLYIIDQSGKVITFDDRIFIDMLQFVVPLNPLYDERGLLGLAFHPEFSNIRSSSYKRFFLFYSTPTSVYQQKTNDRSQPYALYCNVLSEFRADPINNTGLLNSEQILLAVPKYTVIHNGGNIAFGPDGYMYLGLGDGGEQKDPHNNAQNIQVLLGKILRIDVDGKKPYSIPKDNPLFGVGLPEIYAYGFRNPWGISWDKLGRMFVANVGHHHKEELNLVIPGGNYGWNVKEGSDFTTWGDPVLRSLPFIDPIYEFAWRPLSAIIGGYSDKPGSYWFGNYNGRIYHIHEANGIWKLDLDEKLDGWTYVKAFGKDSIGNLYVLGGKAAGPRDKNGFIAKLIIE